MYVALNGAAQAMPACGHPHRHAGASDVARGGIHRGGEYSDIAAFRDATFRFGLVSIDWHNV